MKKPLPTILVVAALLVVGAGWYSYMNSQQGESTNDEGATPQMSSPVSVTPVEHASAVFEWGDTTLYADPVGGAEAFEDSRNPDMILLTDIHGDHLDPETLNAVIQGETSLIAPQAVVDELPANLAERAQVLANGESMTEAGFSIRAIPMYNLPESNDAYHVKGRGNGYVVERDDYRLYLAGDTSGIPEMRNLDQIDMAFVPMNLPYTMDVEEAADAVLDFAPGRVYPYHYRGQDGLSDVDRFRDLVEEESETIEVVLLDWYPNR